MKQDPVLAIQKAYKKSNLKHASLKELTKAHTHNGKAVSLVTISKALKAKDSITFMAPQLRALCLALNIKLTDLDFNGCHKTPSQKRHVKTIGKNPLAAKLRKRLDDSVLSIKSAAMLIGVNRVRLSDFMQKDKLITKKEIQLIVEFLESDEGPKTKVITKNEDFGEIKINAGRPWPKPTFNQVSIMRF